MREKGTRYKENKMAMNKNLTIITLNVNGLHDPIKTHWVAKWIRKHDPHICCLQETHLRTKYLHRLKLKGWKTNMLCKQAGRENRGNNGYI